MLFARRECPQENRETTAADTALGGALDGSTGPWTRMRSALAFVAASGRPRFQTIRPLRRTASPQSSASAGGIGSEAVSSAEKNENRRAAEDEQHTADRSQ